MAKIYLAEYQKSLSLFFQNCMRYPTDIEGLEALVVQPGGCPNWGPEPYIKRLVKDPWGQPFIYEANQDGYALKTLGEDKAPGGEQASLNLSDIPDVVIKPCLDVYGRIAAPGERWDTSDALDSNIIEPPHSILLSTCRTDTIWTVVCQVGGYSTKYLVLRSTKGSGETWNAPTVSKSISEPKNVCP